MIYSLLALFISLPPLSLSLYLYLYLSISIIHLYILHSISSCLSPVDHSLYLISINIYLYLLLLYRSNIVSLSLTLSLSFLFCILLSFSLSLFTYPLVFQVPYENPSYQRNPRKMPPHTCLILHELCLFPL